MISCMPPQAQAKDKKKYMTNKTVKFFKLCVSTDNINRV